MSEPGPDVGDAGAALAGFAESPFLLTAHEGPEHVVAAASLASREAAPDGLVGRPGREALSHLLPDSVWRGFDRVLRTGETFRTAVPSPPSGRLDLVLLPWRREDGSVRGVLGYGNVAGRSDPEGTALATALGRVHEEEQGLVTALHDALLPLTLPILPGVHVAAQYLLAEEDGTAGGDWFDALRLPDGRVALVVGDVVGHGVGAASLMGRLQSVLHERLASGAGLPAALACLDRYAAGIPEAAGATVCVVALDAHTGDLEYVTAGHPQPLVVDRSGGFRYLSPSGGSPLATGSRWRPAQEHLGGEEMLLLYSDGIIDRPDRTIGESTVELAQVAAEAFAHRSLPTGRSQGDRATTEILELLVRRTGRTDDVTVLTASLVPRVGDFREVLPADHESIRSVRTGLEAWLRAFDARDLDRQALLHAVSEVVANAVQHAYPGPGPDHDVAVEGCLGDDGRVRITVRDHGRWAERTPGREGRGLALAGGLVDRMAVRSHGGTTVTIEHQLSRPAQLLRSAGQGGGPADVPTAEVVEVGQGRLHAAGALDWGAADRLRAALLRATHAGLRPAVLDLSRVTHLASAATLAIFEARSRSARHGTRLSVVAPPGSPAQHVLEVVGLSYDAAPSPTDGHP